MTPLALVSLLFFALPAPAGAAVQVSLDLTEQAAAESQAKINATETLLGSILGADHRKDRVPKDKDSFFLVYSAERWSPALSREDFARVVVTLKGMWEGRIEFAEPSGQQAGTLGSVEVPRVNLPAGQTFMSQGRIETLTNGNYGAFYDGNLAGSGRGFQPVEAFSFQKPGRTAGDQGIVFSPAAKDKPAAVPPIGGGHPYDAIVAEEAAGAGMDPAVLRAVIEAKGGFETRASRKVGSAHGVMLITKSAAAQVGMKDADLSDARANIRVGARLLAELIDQFRGDVHRALAAYQVGARAVIKSGGIPNDPEVKYFLGAYERALRGKTPKPEVKPVVPPKAAVVRQVRETAAEKVREKAEEILPPSGVVRPRDPVSKYRKTIHLKAEKHGVDPWLVESVMRAENPWGDPMRVSDAGAVGIMQIMPETARMLRIDPRSPVQSIDGGARHLKYLLGLYNGNRVLAVAAYNAGEGAVGERIPNFNETKGYVGKVFGYLEELTGEKVDYASFMPPVRAHRTGRVAARKT